MKIGSWRMAVRERDMVGVGERGMGRMVNSEFWTGNRSCPAGGGCPVRQYLVCIGGHTETQRYVLCILVMIQTSNAPLRLHAAWR